MASGLKSQFLRLRTFSRLLTMRKLSQTSPLASTAQPEIAEKPLSIPQPDGKPKVYSPKLEQIFQSISQLNLLEVAELTELLKSKLNLPDAPMMGFASMPAAKQTSGAGSEDQAASDAVQTSFTVKLKSFDSNKKIAVIKELKNILPDLNLVQAKKFVESAPSVVMKDVGKDEAEKVKDALTKAGGEVVIE